jgi:hypothetical protein
MTSFEILAKSKIKTSKEFFEVEKTAIDLRSFLDQDIIRNKLEQTHKPHAKSGDIQAIFLSKAEELGFVSEKKALFMNYRLRPDYYKSLGNGKGIIMEVERGKTTVNNMDLLDVWKCHICSEANYLFLIVPNIRQTEKGGKSHVFNNVVRRLNAFFETGNEVNVDAIFVFGY